VKADESGDNEDEELPCAKSGENEAKLNLKRRLREVDFRRQRRGDTYCTANM